ncbi:OLC1v1010295C2 [Oldenlandia corymbosa var. corymbosa]|nr:OLC1v1010295C2 [Oldenlandia corymbosa var. corymbosa]
MPVAHSFPLPSSENLTSQNYELPLSTKKKRKPAGTPDPDAEVVYLTPEMLLESDRYVCEICNQSFQREQNLQMHKRRHKVPWKLLKKKDKEEAIKKRVYVCPEPSCLHHNPSHALGDLVGIKKHFRRKHSNNKQWVCDKCTKGYAVQSDFKAHLKICGTRGHSCDCGRVFSRVEAFIEHQDTCKVRMTNYNVSQIPTKPASTFSCTEIQFHHKSSDDSDFCHNLELELFSSSNSSFSTGINNLSTRSKENHHHSTQPLYQETSEGEYSGWCQLDACKINSQEDHHYSRDKFDNVKDIDQKMEYYSEAFRLRNEARELSRVAMEEKALAEEKRYEAKCLIEMAKQEMAKAKKIREQAFAEFNAVQILKDCSTRHVSCANNNNIVQITTCNACRKEFMQEKKPCDQLRVPSHLPFQL